MPNIHILSIADARWASSPSYPTLTLLEHFKGPPLNLKSLTLASIKCVRGTWFEVPALMSHCERFRLNEVEAHRAVYSWSKLVEDVRSRVTSIDYFGYSPPHPSSSPEPFVEAAQVGEIELSMSGRDGSGYEQLAVFGGYLREMGTERMKRMQITCGSVAPGTLLRGLLLLRSS